MLILQLNSVFSEGSVTSIIKDISEVALEKNINTVFVSGPRSNKILHKNQIVIGNKFDSFFQLISSRFFDNHGLSSKWATKKLINKIKEIKPDIIHIHNLHGYYLNYKFLFEFFNKNKLKILMTMHDCWNFTGHCTHFEHINCSKWESICKRCPSISSYPKSFFIDNSYKNFNTKKEVFLENQNLEIVTVSKWLKSKVNKSFLKEKKIHTILNGIDVNVFKPLDLKNEIKKFIILGSARNWSMEKGIYDFIELSNRLGSEFIFYLIGLDKNKFKNLPNNIVPIKKIYDKNEMNLYYNKADLYLNLSYIETFPTTNMESISSGTPVITYDVGGARETVLPDTGKCIKKNDIDMLEKLVIDFKDNKINFLDKNLMHNLCRKYFNYKVNFEDYIKIYKSMI